MPENSAKKKPLQPELNADVMLIDDGTMGNTKISGNAIASVVRKCALSTEGVSRFAPSGVVEGIADMLSSRSYDRSITIEITDGQLVITLALILLFDCNVGTVAKNIRQSIQERLAGTLNITINKINIFVKELEDIGAAEEEETDI